MGNSRTSQQGRDRGRLALAALVSVALHAALASAWVVNGVPDSSSDNLNRPRPEIRFGVKSSPHQTIAWLGFINPTPSSADLSITEQSQLSPNPPSPAQESAPAFGSAFLEALQSSLTNEPALDRFRLMSRESANALLRAVQAAAQQQAQSEPEQQTADSQEPEPTEASEPLQASPDAIESPKEADAASLKKPMEYRKGKVAAREGLDITTVRPKWQLGTLVTANPANPVVWIEFAADGRVKTAGFEGKGTGSEAVDGPLLDAIYSWTAKGEEIDALAEESDDATLRVTVRIGLR